MDTFELGEVVYYARILESNYLAVYEVVELKIRAIYDDSIVGWDKSGYAYLVSTNPQSKLLYKNRHECLQYVNSREDKKY